MKTEKKSGKKCFAILRKAFVFSLFFLFFSSTIVWADSVIPKKDNGQWNRTLLTAGNDQLIGLNYSLRTLLWTSGVVLESAQNILTRVADISFYQQQLGGFYNKKEIGANGSKGVGEGSGWAIVRTICMGFVVIILIFIAFGTILRVESYNYKYLLVKLLVVAFLIQSSGFISGIILDFSHILMGTFSDKIANIGIAIQKNSKILDEYVNNMDLGDINAVSNDLNDNITRTISRVNVNMILASVLMFILGITVLAVAIFLIVRTVSLWLLFTLSPAALALAVLPHTRYASLKWWDAFLKNAFAGPLLFFFLYLTLFITENLSIPSETAVAGDDRFIIFSNSGSFLNYLFLVVLLWASVFLSRSLSIAGAIQVVGNFRDLSRGERSMRIVNKLVDSGNSILQKTGAGKIIHQWTGAPLQVKGEGKLPYVTAPGTAERTAAGRFQPMLKAQTEATQKALKSLLNPAAVGRVLSLVDSRRKGEGPSVIGGDLRSAAQFGSLSTKDPGEYLRTLWKRFAPQVKPTGNFWRDAKIINEEINKEIETQTNVRRIFNEVGLNGQKIMNFEAKNNDEREAQIYKMAWTGALPDFFTKKMGKSYNHEELAKYLKETFGEKRGGEVAEKLTSIAEIKKDPSLAVAAWNEKKERYEVSVPKPAESAKPAVGAVAPALPGAKTAPAAQTAQTSVSVNIKPEDLKKLAPQSLLTKNEKGEYNGFNEFGKQLLKQMTGEYLKEVKNMREDTVKAITQAYSSSQRQLTQELSKNLGKIGRSSGTVQAETIKAIGKAQMQGAFHVEQVQAPNSRISLGQEFLNRVAGRAFAAKQVSTGGVKVAKSDSKAPVEKKEGFEAENTVEKIDKTAQNQTASRAFAAKQVDTGGVETAKAEAPLEEESSETSLKDKQKYLMLGGANKMATDDVG